MSDDEDVVHSDEENSEEEEEEETNEEPEAPAKSEPSGPSEAEIAMQKRRAMDKLTSVKGLDEHDQEMLAANQVERDNLAKEISEMKARSERRKKEREEEEKRLAEQRAAEDARRKAEEEERRKRKDEEESKRKAERAQKMAEFEKWKNPPTPNFVITKKAGPAVSQEEEEAGAGGGVEKKSREQLEAEKKAILAQRIQPLNIDGADMGKLTEKAKELQALIVRLESEKYDLERRFKTQQYDMMELAERARQMNKVGRGGQIKRVQLEDDKMQTKFAGCPSKIVMYSEYERQKDPRGYQDRQNLFVGPVYGYPAERIAPTRVIKWNESTGLPEYEELPGAATAGGEGGEEE